MDHKWLVGIIGAGLWLALLPAGAVWAAPDLCAVPRDLLQDESPLPMTAAAIENKRPLRIVAIGSGSTLGRAAGGPDHAYPHFLEQILRRRFPAIPITVINRAAPRQSALEMVQRFESDVFTANPTLLIWELGTKEAVHGADPEALGQILQAGLDRLRKRRIDVIVMDMQYSRATAAMINFEPYLGALHRIADGNDVQVFQRFAMMRYWSESEIFDFDSAPSSSRQHMAEQVYDCIARRLSDVIARASQ
jgi:hypothetical protein